MVLRHAPAASGRRNLRKGAIILDSIDRRERSFRPWLAWLAACLLVAGGHATADTPGLPLGDPLADIGAALGSPVQIEAAIEPGEAGGPDVLAVTATLEEGWHLYSITQKPGGPTPTRIVVDPGAPRQPAGPFEPDVPPHVGEAEGIPAWKGLVIEEHSGRVTWRAPLKSGTGDVTGSVSLQLCQDNACTPPETIPFVATGSGGTAAAAADLVGYQPDRAHTRVEAAARGGAGGATVTIRLLPEPGWHLYAPASQGTSDVGQGKPTIVGAVSTGETAGPLVGVSATAIPSTAPELAAAGAVDGPVALEVALGGVPAGASVGFVVGFQTCSDSTCDPPTGMRVSVTIPEASGRPVVELSEARYVEAAKAPADVAVSLPAATSATASAAAIGAVGAASPAAAAPAAPASVTLPVALLMGLAGGLILNLMPCVLPVLGLKLMSFAQQAGQARREVFQTNLWYCAGLYAVFFVLATASVAANIGLASSNLAWGEQFTSAGFNIAMLGVVFAFALSFLGIWELPIPGFIGAQAGQVQSREGPLGAFLKGVLSTVLATPCSGPFLGPVFGFTLTQSTAVTYAVFGAIATGMALPYIAVGLFPGLVRFLPKPGAWMGTFKEVLGFVMLGTVAYLFTFLHHDWFVPTFVMLVGIWAGCWWVGREQERRGAVGFGRWLQAAVVATAIASAAFFFLGPTESLLAWEQPFSRQRLAELRERGATVMVDFSADWCPTCKFNLATAIETRRVRAAVEKNQVVPVLADWTDGSLEIKQMLEALGSKSIPVLAIFPAGTAGTLPEPIVLRDLITESQVLEAIERAGPSRSGAPAVRSARAQPPAGL